MWYLIIIKNSLIIWTCFSIFCTLQNSTNSEENVNQPNIVETNKNNIDDLLEMLANEGFTNTIQNIIVLKRFDNDFDKAISYLKSSAT